MGEGEEMLELGLNVVDRKMEEAQRAALLRKWNDFKKFFANNKQELLKPMDIGLNTAFHVAVALASTRDAKLLKELLEMVGEKEIWRALRKANGDGDTLLHLAAANCKELDVVELVLRYEKVVQPPLEDEETEKDSEEKKMPLLELRNDYDETPIFTAAKEGNLKMLQHVAKCVSAAELRKHFYRGVDKTSILHIAIIGQHFVLPEHEYEDFDNESIKVLRQGTESSNGGEGNGNNGNAHTSEWRLIDDIWQTKKQHKLVLHLTKLLVPKDYSWQQTNNIHVTEQRQRTVSVIPIFERSVSQRKRLIQKKRNRRHDEKGGAPKQVADVNAPIISKSPTPLLLAASTGNVEIVEHMIERHPDAINHVGEKLLDVLQVAVMTRQLEVYEFLRNCCGTSIMKKLAGRIGQDGRTVLHYVAGMKYYKRRHEAGVVYELQEELLWFERVRNITPSYLEMHCNEENQTGKDVFETEHDGMLKSAQEWLKQTSQSCSAVGVLVATVVFAAIYQVPGGTDDNGIPKLIGSSDFLFFTVTDVLALGSSLSSVVMFLSILSSPFDMWEFRSSLPRRLSLGFIMLFFALITTMMSFAATILLTVNTSLRSKKTWSANLLYSVAFIPVTIFALMQFPLNMTFKRAATQLWTLFINLVPYRVIKSTRRSEKRRFRRSLVDKVEHF
ncbi:hypothetical protein PIB30_054497 [Stylosanthes scabra]|uniref:PGG domain-containing protein n=1 Tax=Stylosanthes scabra TaxID=79078 RepID=A0ABU6RJG3_9FABA|nr:hypothetical protein [Stylosanthes scabra]